MGTYDEHFGARTFYLKWRDMLLGHEFVSAYYYDGCGDQDNYTFEGWRARCISRGWANGFEYRGKATAEDYRCSGRTTLGLYSQ